MSNSNSQFHYFSDKNLIDVSSIINNILIYMHLLTTSVLIAVTELASDTPQFFRRIGVNFNGRFLAGCCWLETHAIATSSMLNKGLLWVLEFLNF